MFSLFLGDSCELSQESVLYRSLLISNNFPLNRQFIRSTLHWLNLHLTGSCSTGCIFLRANHPWKSSYWQTAAFRSVPTISVLEAMVILRYWPFKFSPVWFGLFTCLLFNSKINKVQQTSIKRRFWEVPAVCAFSKSAASEKSHVKINRLFPTANKYLPPLCEAPAYTSPVKTRFSSANRRFPESRTEALDWYLEC